MSLILLDSEKLLVKEGFKKDGLKQDCFSDLCMCSKSCSIQDISELGNQAVEDFCRLWGDTFLGDEGQNALG